MVLVQILLPLFTNDGAAIGATQFRRVREELTKKVRRVDRVHACAGRWKDDGDENAVQHDDILIFEVMVERVRML